MECEDLRLQGFSWDRWAVSKGQKELKLVRPKGTAQCQVNDCEGDFGRLYSIVKLFRSPGLLGFRRKILDNAPRMSHLFCRPRNVLFMSCSRLSRASFIRSFVFVCMK